MRLVAGCNSGSCSAVYVDDDGSVVVQGQFVGAVWAPTGKHMTERDEARVRIPADVHRSSVLGQALAYEVTMGKMIYHVRPEDVRVVFPAAETAEQR